MRCKYTSPAWDGPDRECTAGRRRGRKVKQNVGLQRSNNTSFSVGWLMLVGIHLYHRHCASFGLHITTGSITGSPPWVIGSPRRLHLPSGQVHALILGFSTFSQSGKRE